MNIQNEISSFKNMLNGYKLTFVIDTANKIGIFKALDVIPKKIESIALELNLEKDKIEPILNALTAKELINKNEDGYFLDKYNDVFNKNSEYNQSGYIDFAISLIDKYKNLEKSIKKPDLAESNFKNLTEENAENFVKGMSANAFPQAEFIVNNYDFNNRKILDVGAGAGTYLIAATKKFKSVTGNMIDLPKMSKIQNRIIKQEGLQNKLKSIELDYNYEFPKEKYDDVFLFAVVHQEKEDKLEKLLKNIYNVLNPDGRVFITSFFLNEDKISPEFSVQFAVEMIAASNNGKVYTHTEIQNIIRKCGFNIIEKRDDIPSPATLYIAQK